MYFPSGNPLRITGWHASIPWKGSQDVDSPSVRICAQTRGIAWPYCWRFSSFNLVILGERGARLLFGSCYHIRSDELQGYPTWLLRVCPMEGIWTWRWATLISTNRRSKKDSEGIGWHQYERRPRIVSQCTPCRPSISSRPRRHSYNMRRREHSNTTPTCKERVGPTQ